MQMLEVYRDFAESYMAMPVITGEKTESERFPGAVNTLCIEAMMQDRKALQSGTSHFLGQNFSKSSKIMFQSRQGRQEYVWTSSWGVSTRMIGGLIMVHGDDDGMVMPPRLAPAHVAILPILREKTDVAGILAYCDELANRLRTLRYSNRAIEVLIDRREINAGERSWQWTKKGIPLRLEIGKRDVEKNAVFMARRDRGPKEKQSIRRDEFIETLPKLLDEIQGNLLQRARKLLEANTRHLADYDKFRAFFTPANREKPEIHGGFVYSPWCGNTDCEDRVKSELSVTIRCIPFDQKKNGEACVVCGEPSRGIAVFAKTY
jgi:prolyl-tRNA synthetase